MIYDTGKLNNAFSFTYFIQDELFKFKEEYRKKIDENTGKGS